MELAPLLPVVARSLPLAGNGFEHGAVVAVPDQAVPVVLSAMLSKGMSRPLAVATATAGDAERIARDMAAFLGDGPVELFSAWDTLPFERVSPEVSAMGRRLSVLWRLEHDPPDVLVAPVRALLQRLAPRLPDELVVAEVQRGSQLDQGELVARLVAMGYRREYQVEHRGELAVRGGIVDVFPSVGGFPVRIDMFGDQVDRLAELDPATQRSLAPLEVVRIFGCRELLAVGEVRERARGLLQSEPWGRRNWERVAAGEMFDGMESWMPWLAEDERLLTDLLPETAQVVLVEPRRIRDRADELVADEEALATALASTWGASGAATFPRLHLPMERLLERCTVPVLAMPSVPDRPSTPAVEVRAWGVERAAPEVLAGRLGALVADGYSVTLCARGDSSASRMSAQLVSEGLVVTSSDIAAAGMHVVASSLDRGAVLPAAGVAILGESDLTGRLSAHRVPRARARAVDGFFDDLTPGDFVVHRQHGVARFAGMVTRTVQGATRDYLLLEYRGDDRLYLPTDQIDALTPYSGGESPSLSRLGGSEWQRTRAKARAAVHEVAKDLVDLYRSRANMEGYSFPPDTPWQAEMEDAFEFVETADQLRAVADVKADMEAPVPMDRLVCGDVGFGKTEVALRAVFKAVQDSKQAAVLVPTTLLAQQHAQTFTERLAGFSVKVEMLSRFLTPAGVLRVLGGLADGTVDVVIGTHRLLADDVRFKNLGLLVVDEEQRFGVSHKEAIKALTQGVDVLTLSASPIPRTLELALTGIRDLSLVNTPPAERQPILTYVGEYDESAVVEAIRRELLREGQVFFVHNRVRDIDLVADRLRHLVPEARVAVAHGQMDEGTLEQVVIDFWQGKYDVLVCTTIIESGIDMPTVNTLVVDRADRLGLGQLHQLRGRVGRAGQRAYAYLFHPAEATISETAYERLRTIGENTELGSGFKIAMRDLEIRGAGNLLGYDQSGHIATIGYDLYVQMVSEAVAEMKGEPLHRPPEVSIDLPGEATIPHDYMSRDDLRLEAYRRLAAATSPAEVADVQSEWEDRFGPLPDAVRGLLAAARLRAECLRTGVTEVSVSLARPGQVRGVAPGRRIMVARLGPLQLLASAQVRLRRTRPHALYKEESSQLVVPLVGDSAPADELVELLHELVPPGS